MTLREELSKLRNAVKEVTDDSKISDTLLYSYWKDQRARVLGQKKLLHSWMYQRFCMDLEKVKSHDCDCVEIGCDVLRTVSPVPSAISDSLEVLTLDSSPIGLIEERALKSESYDQFLKGKMRCSVYNRYVYIWNNLDMKKVQFNGVWSDPLAWQDIQACTEDNPCVDIYDLNIGLNEEEAASVVRLTTELLLVSRQIPDDQTQDRNTEIRA